MGFFSEIASEARRSSHVGALPQPAAPDILPREAPPKPAPAAPKPEPAPPAPEPAPAPEQKEQPPAPSAHTPPPPEVKLAVGDTAPTPDDDAKRKAHEAAEAKRKAEFDAKQAEKKAARQAALIKKAFSTRYRKNRPRDDKVLCGRFFNEIRRHGRRKAEIVTRISRLSHISAFKAVTGILQLFRVITPPLPLCG